MTSLRRKHEKETLLPNRSQIFESKSWRVKLWSRTRFTLAIGFLLAVLFALSRDPKIYRQKRTSFGLITPAIGFENRTWWRDLHRQNRECYAKIHGYDSHIEYCNETFVPSGHW